MLVNRVGTLGRERMIEVVRAIGRGVTHKMDSLYIPLCECCVEILYLCAVVHKRVADLALVEREEDVELLQLNCLSRLWLGHNVGRLRLLLCKVRARGSRLLKCCDGHHITAQRYVVATAPLLLKHKLGVGHPTLEGEVDLVLLDLLLAVVAAEVGVDTLIHIALLTFVYDVAATSVNDHRWQLDYLIAVSYDRHKAQ